MSSLGDIYLSNVNLGTNFFKFNKNNYFKYRSHPNKQMNVKEYWSKFPPINSDWYKLLAAIYGLIGISGLCLNVLVLNYLLR